MSDPRITDEAVEAALDVVMDDGHNGLDCRPGRNLEVTVRAALEAALPYLTPQPVASQERVAEGLIGHQVTYISEAKAYDCSCDDLGLFDHMPTITEAVQHQADALLAAGVFREPPTREQVTQWVAATLTYERFKDWTDEQFADAVLALIGGFRDEPGAKP